MLALLVLTGCQGLLDPARAWVDGAGAAGRDGPLLVAAGSTVDLTFQRRLAWTLADVTLVCTAPGVLSIAEQESADRSVRATVIAFAAGSAELQLIRDGEPLYTLPVEVRVPDRLTLHAVGPSLAQGQLSPAEARPSLLRGGGARFLVTLHAGDHPLVGRGTLEAAGNDGLDVSVRIGDVDALQHDSLIVHAPAVGPVPDVLHVTASAVPFEHPLRVRTADEVAGLRLLGPTHRDILFYEHGFVMAEALDAAGEAIHGVPVTWAWGGNAFQGEGEVFRYMSGDEAPRPLRAEFAQTSVEMELSGTQGTVLDVTRECGTVPGGASRVGALAGVVLLLRRRPRPTARTASP
ncbi:MAG: hypothetical protein Q8P41_21970 [Pseudomonadota bacterium]|nr:hypothetical protein [Pseudomonadota bacterium]